MAGPSAPVVIRDTAGWLAGDGSSIASIAPPNGSTTAIAFALDTTGQRLAIAWAADDGTVTLAVHDGRSDWRRTAQPDDRRRQRRRRRLAPLAVGVASGTENRGAGRCRRRRRPSTGASAPQGA